MWAHSKRPTEMTDELREPLMAVLIMQPTGFNLRYVQQYGIAQVMSWTPGSNADLAIEAWNIENKDKPIQKGCFITAVDQFVGVNDQPQTASQFAFACRPPLLGRQCGHR